MNYINIIIIVMAAGLCAVAITAMKLPKFRHLFCVPEGCAGLLYRDGLYVRRHNAGRKVVWGFGWTMKLVDLRKASMTVAAQEVLTADNVSLKLSLLVTYQVDDPVIAAHGTQDWPGELCNAAQLALRDVAAKVTTEALLNRRLELGAQLLARVRPEAARIGASVLAVGVKDVILPAELRQTFANALKAKQPVGQGRIVAVEDDGGSD